jgi:hypothetical protein
MRPLRLNDGSYDGDMVDPLVMIPFLLFVLEVRAGPFDDHMNHFLEGWIGEVFLLWWWGVRC